MIIFIIWMLVSAYHTENVVRTVLFGTVLYFVPLGWFVRRANRRTTHYAGAHREKGYVKTQRNNRRI